VVFEKAWLELREPADIQARDAGLLERAAALLDQPDPIVVDLGCGTGATVRAISPLLRRPVRWRLIDNDPVLLLAAASARLGEQVETVPLDIAQLNDLPLTGASLVTASALFDLCSAPFVDKLANLLANRRLGLYAALNYDGTIVWQPPHRYDAKIVELFNSHQRSDKGLGRALGSDAARVLAATFTRLGYDVALANSPWHLSRNLQTLQAAFIDGIVTAVGELQAIEPSALQTWRRSRLEALLAGASCRVGHLDCLAQPSGAPTAMPGGPAATEAPINLEFARRCRRSFGPREPREAQGGRVTPPAREASPRDRRRRAKRSSVFRPSSNR
jgi:SAM-dependent methyltransferase